MPKLTNGLALSKENQHIVLNQFIHRWTRDNPHRSFAWHAYPATERPRIPLITDQQWLADHCFPLNRNGTLSRSMSYAEPSYLAE